MKLTKFQIIIIFTIFILCSRSVFSQIFKDMPIPSNDDLIFIFYNCENLFDTLNDISKNDNNFTTEGKKSWNSEKYYKKLNNISKVLTSLHKTNYPAIIGLCEVENRKVIEDLLTKTSLKEQKYSIIHHESGDPRGIDVALIYRNDLFKLYKEYPLFVLYSDSNLKRKRHIQYASLIVKDCDTLHIFINHWKSRIGGKEKTEPIRLEEAKTLRYYVDSVLYSTKNPKIIIAGDFNDEPHDKSISEILKANADEKKLMRKELYNLMVNLKNKGYGTHLHDKEWNLFDQIIVNKGMFSSNIGCIYSEPFLTGIISFDWLFKINKNGDRYLYSTFKNNKYIGGYSDHLPVYLILKLK